VLTALLIMLREGFEAALVVAIVYAYIRRIGRRDLVGPMWQGMAAAAAVSVAAGVAVHLTIEQLTGEPRLLAFAAVSLLAVAREGLEAALFLLAASTTENGWAVLAGGLVGLTVAAGLGALVVLGGRRLPMRQFFTVTGLVLIVFAAGLVSRTVLWLQAAGELGSLWNSVYDLTAYRWLTVGSETGRFLGAMFGWDPRPSIEQVVAYLLFLGTVSWLFLRAPARSPAR
jgi:high-affinity iron transporter